VGGVGMRMGMNEMRSARREMSMMNTSCCYFFSLTPHAHTSLHNPPHVSMSLSRLIGPVSKRQLPTVGLSRLHLLRLRWALRTRVQHQQPQSARYAIANDRHHTALVPAPAILKDGGSFALLLTRTRRKQHPRHRKEERHKFRGQYLADKKR
jgi:hypothetical protein